MQGIARAITALFAGSIEPGPDPGQPAPAQPSPSEPAEVKPRRRERLAAPHRRRLITEAAREAFLEKGLSGARMKDIAQRAGLTDAGLYAHFSSKDELYRAAVQEPLDQLVARFTADLRTLADIPGTDRAELLRRVNEQLLSCIDAAARTGPVLPPPVTNRLVRSLTSKVPRGTGTRIA